MELTTEQIKEQAARPGRRYIVQELVEETQCDGCGYPLYIGDDCYEVGDEAACGRACAEQIEARQQRREEAIARVCPLTASEIEASRHGGAL